MSTKTHLESQFKKAGIPINVTERAFVRDLRGGGEITQIDIQRFRGNYEEIICFPGDGSELQVLNVDKKHNQVVLSVKEPERRFQEKKHLPWGKLDPETGKRYTWEERVTPADTRKLLIGMDERHLFVAQLDDGSRTTTVRQAHENLAPAGIPGTTKKRKKQGIKRQGEWFFVPITTYERSRIEDHIKLAGTEKKMALGSGGDGRRGATRGRPHVVSERARIGGRRREEIRDFGSGPRVSRVWHEGWTEYARGTIKHPDHKTIRLQDWYRVVSNTENRSVGATWVD